MRKRVLVAEVADTTRTVAESILRQNGYEVISVSSAEKAGEVLQFSRPDLVIVGADLCTSNQRPFFEKIQEDARVASLPLLLFAPEDRSSLSFPDEAVISQPIDPKELLQKTAVFLGQVGAAGVKAASDPPGEVPVDDEFLDAALGLDQISVTDSEVMDKTWGIRMRRRRPSSEDMVGSDQEGKEDTDMTDSSRVESLIIQDDTTDIVNKPVEKKPPPPPSGTGKLEIMGDQYGLADPGAFKASSQEGVAHDYDWFIDSIRDDVESPSPSSAATESGDAKQQSGNDSGKLTYTEPSSAVDPVTPAPSGLQASPPAEKKSASVEEFINEFKKEMDSLRSTEPENVVLSEDVAAGEKTDAELSWEDRLETITTEEVGLFTRQLASELAEKIAERIAAKLSPEKLLQLIKNDVVNRARKKS